MTWEAVIFDGANKITHQAEGEVVREVLLQVLKNQYTTYAPKGETPPTDETFLDDIRLTDSSDVELKRLVRWTEFYKFNMIVEIQNGLTSPVGFLRKI